MATFRRLIARLRRLARRVASDRELQQEIASHLDEAIEEFRQQGLSPAAARVEALRRFGGVAQAAEAYRDAGAFAWLDALRRDVRQAFRTLRRSPAFTAAAIATLAVVIGANGAVFGMADALLWTSLPYPHADRLARVVWARPDSIQESVDGRTWEAVRDDVKSLDVAITAGEPGQRVNFNTDTVADFVRQTRVGSGYFRVLGVPLALGREFLPIEDVPGGAPVVVLSHDLWTRVFHADPSVIGHTLLLRGDVYEIVGVLPPDFVGPTGRADVFTPVRAARSGEGGGANYQIVARLRDGRTWPDANGELGNIGRALQTNRSATTNVPLLSARSLQSVLTADLETPVHLLVGAVLLLLVMASVNLAALLLARGSDRRREFATRLALGCSRLALVRQLVVESLMLGVAGGLVGVVLGEIFLVAMRTQGSAVLTDWSRIALSGRVLAGIGIGSLAAALFCGLVSALISSRIDVNGALVDNGSRAIAGGAHRWGRRALIGVEVALSAVLLVVTGLFLRTMAGLNRLDPGFDPSHLSATSVSLQDARYQSADAINRLFTESLAVLERTPGIDAAAVSLELPYSRLLNDAVRFADAPATAPPQMANVTYVTPSFFHTLKIPIRAGRVFTLDDRTGRPPVVVVNDAFVRYLAGGANIIGHVLRIDGDDLTVVGVVGDMRTRSSGIPVPGMPRGPLEAPPIAFLPAAQVSDGFLRLVHQWFAPYWTVRTTDGVNADAALRAAIAAADPRLPIEATQHLSDVQADATAFQRFMLRLVGAFAGIALLLASIGIYGVIAQSVLDRTRELGVRLALGATLGGTIRRVIWSGVALVAAGMTAGGALAWMATRLIASLLWGVTPHDPLTFIAAGGLLLLVAVASSLVPALRILRLDPAKILRS
jgi:predicted permease